MVLRSGFAILEAMKTVIARQFLGPIIILALLVGTASIAAHRVAAQAIEITSSDIILTINPENPEPNTLVTFTLDSYVINISNRPIRWFVNGKLIEQGTGKDVFSINSGVLGTRTTVEALITTQNGNIITKTMVISPLGVDLLWEATDSYVPPFYKGKKLPAPQGIITVTAFPITAQGRVADQKNSVYYWSNDFEAIPNASGYGKQSLSIQNSMLNKSETIQLTAASPTGSYQATKSVTIPTFDPKIIVYKKNSDQVTDWSRGFTTTVPVDEGGDIHLVAEPYFFSVDRPFALRYDWRNQTQSFIESSLTQRAERLLTMEARGSTSLTIKAEHPNNLLQAASRQLQLVY